MRRESMGWGGGDLEGNNGIIKGNLGIKIRLIYFRIWLRVSYGL